MQLKIGDKTIPYTIRKSQRAQTLTFRVNEKGLEVVIPSGYYVPDLSDLENLLYKKSGWILKSLEYMEKHRAVEKQFVSGEKLLFLGEEHELEVIPLKSGKKTSVGREASTIRVWLRSGVSESARSKEIRSALERWYRGQAKHYIEFRTESLARHLGFQYEKITIRGQRTRWGSCSSQGNLNFNWRLIMAPLDAIDYVIIHELCHLVEHNHSRRFWEMLDTYCPSYEVWKHWLSANNPQMFF